MSSLTEHSKATLRSSKTTPHPPAFLRSLAYLLSWGNKPWERLAQRLKDENIESIYVDRLERKMGKKVTIEDQIHELEQEILQETASALRKSEDKVNYLLLQLQVKGIDIDRATCDAVRGQLIRDFNHLRQEAIAARRDLTIHREACGMRIKNWERTLRLYQIPPRCPPDATTSPKVHDTSGQSPPSLHPTLSSKELMLEQERDKVRERARQRAQSPPKVWTRAERDKLLAGKNWREREISCHPARPSCTRQKEVVDERFEQGKRLTNPHWEEQMREMNERLS